MNGPFIIPANSKKGQLILGLFRPLDLIIFAVGISLTFILLVSIGPGAWYQTVLILAPALISTFLILPLPNYHNVLTLIISINKFYSSRQKYIWRGWCIHEEDEQQK